MHTQASTAYQKTDILHSNDTKFHLISYANLILFEDMKHILAKYGNKTHNQHTYTYRCS